MVCPHCQRTVPDESAFCLACGRRLAPAVATSANGNGDGGAPAPEQAGTGPPDDPDPTRKRPWALSLGAVVDERLRYRVARWVVEHAPAHTLTEVQESLRQGQFVTFLALTAAEADAIRTGISGLGLPTALVTLVPAAGAQPLIRPLARARTGRPRTGAARWLLPALLVAGLLLAGVIAFRLIVLGRGL